MTYANQYEEHQAHSSVDNSRWDGFDRGCDFELDQGSRTIGRMTSEAGKRVEIVEFWNDDFRFYEVLVNRRRVFESEERARAIRVARWWMDGCPA